MPKVKSDQNSSILEYALSHLQREREEIQSKIDHVLSQLGMSVAAPVAPAPKVKAKAEVAPAETQEAPEGTRKKRVLSASARKRIALAQKKRWAEHRKAKGL